MKMLALERRFKLQHRQGLVKTSSKKPCKTTSILLKEHDLPNPQTPSPNHRLRRRRFGLQRPPQNPPRLPPSCLYSHRHRHSAFQAHNPLRRNFHPSRPSHLQWCCRPRNLDMRHRSGGSYQRKQSAWRTSSNCARLVQCREVDHE